MAHCKCCAFVRNWSLQAGERAMMMLLWILIGLAIGLIARFIGPRGACNGIAAILLSIAGALLAGFTGLLAGAYGKEDALGFAVAAGGALLALGLCRLVNRA